MYEYNCSMCGKHLVAKEKGKVRKFCGMKCFGKFLHLKANEKTDMQSTPNLAPLKKISDEGYLNLVKAMVEQARNDVLQYAPGTLYRRDAEEFLASDYFFALTGIDGFEVLCKLQDEYDRKHQKKGAKKHVAE